MLKIEIELGPNDGSHVTIQGNVPQPPADAEAFQKWDERWQALCNGVHAIVASLGPIPPEGWLVTVWADWENA